jgi:hypothetical protein
MSSTLTDLEMVERRCHAWEKTRQRGQFLYAIVRGGILGGFWFLLNNFFNAFGKDKMSYEAMAVVSSVFFLMGCYEAPNSWKKAERRYESDKQYLEAMRQLDSNAAKQLSDVGP